MVKVKLGCFVSCEDCISLVYSGAGPGDRVVASERTKLSSVSSGPACRSNRDAETELATVSEFEETTAFATTGSVTAGLTNLLGRKVISGCFPQGTTLPNEARISARFTVGRSAVREAVKMLAAKGLVQSRPRRGTQVLPAKNWNFFDKEVLSWLRDSGPQLDTIAELLELRLGVEPQAAALAARKGSPDQVASIRSAYSAMCAAAEGEADPVQADCAFHEAIIVATSNRFFQPFGLLVRTALSVTAPTTNAIFGHSVGDLDGHASVIAAIEASHPAEAYKRMNEMLSEVLLAVEQARARARQAPKVAPGTRRARSS